MFAIDWSVHWTWFHYFVPSLWGNGPEAIAQTVVYGVAAVLFVPPIRRWFGAHIKSIHDKLDGHHEELLRQGERHHVAAMKQAQKHHEEHLAAIAAAKPTPRKKQV
jgi:mono/diheme cytochrome c family protein